MTRTVLGTGRCGDCGAIRDGEPEEIEEHAVWCSVHGPHVCRYCRAPLTWVGEESPGDGSGFWRADGLEGWLRVGCRVESLPVGFEHGAVSFEVSWLDHRP